MNRVVLALLLGALALGPLPAVSQSPRTSFERLQFATPEQAAAAFLEAYRRQDFVTVFWILSPRSQDAVSDAIVTFALDRLLGPEARLDHTRPHNVTLFERAIPPLSRWEQRDTSWVFDHIMMTGHDLGNTPWTVPENTQPGTARALSDGHVAMAYDPLEIRLARSPQGHWRVLGVFAPGGDPEALPWGFRP